MSIEDKMREAVRAAMEVGYSESEIVAIARTITREETQARTEATAREIYGQKDS